MTSLKVRIWRSARFAMLILALSSSLHLPSNGQAEPVLVEWGKLAKAGNEALHTHTLSLAREQLADALREGRTQGLDVAGAQ